MIELFPTFDELACATPNEIREITSRLGLRWRTELLLEMVEELKTKYSGRIPKERKELLLLPGISNYIASALRCFAFRIPDALLDTNTVRIIGRLFGKKITDSSRKDKKFASLYLELSSYSNCRNFGFALIDLGALICLSKNPKCHLCPISCFCSYSKGQRV